MLSDGTVAKAGGRVIKNVAGYDLGKLFAGSLGNARADRHPWRCDCIRCADTTATARAVSAEPGTACRGAVARLAALPLEADCLDVAWDGGSGEVLVRFGGTTAADAGRGHQRPAARARTRGRRGDR